MHGQRRLDAFARGIRRRVQRRRVEIRRQINRDDLVLQHAVEIRGTRDRHAVQERLLDAGFPALRLLGLQIGIVDEAAWAVEEAVQIVNSWRLDNGSTSGAYT